MPDDTDRTVRPSERETGSRKRGHHDGHADELDGKATAEGEIGSDGRDDGHRDHGGADHGPARDFARQPREGERGAGVAEHVAAVEPEQRRRDRGGHGDGRPDDEGAEPGATRSRLRAGGAVRAAGRGQRLRRRGAGHPDGFGLVGLVDAILAHAPPPRAPPWALRNVSSSHELRDDRSPSPVRALSSTRVTSAPSAASLPTRSS